MKVLLSHKYSELDKCHQFGLEKVQDNGYPYWWWWVWFYIGRKTKGRLKLYPFPMGKVIKEYKYHPADKMAQLIIDKMKKIEKK